MGYPKKCRVHIEGYLKNEGFRGKILGEKFDREKNLYFFCGKFKKIKIMSKSIVEINNYFNERPELWAKLREVINDGTDSKVPHSPVSVGKWGKSLAGGVVGGSNSLIASSIMDAFGKLDESVREAGEEFKRWYLGEWQEEHVVCYKGFNKDLTCMDFQYEVGKEYEMEGRYVCVREASTHVGIRWMSLIFIWGQTRDTVLWSSGDIWRKEEGRRYRRT